MIDQWPAHVEAMRTNGLTIKMPEEEKHVDVDAHHLCDVAGMNRTFGLVLVMPKAYDTRWMAQLMEPHLADDGLMIGIQNAMTAGIIEDVAGPARTLGCVVELSSEIFTPGLVQRNTPPAKTWFGIGALSPEMAGRIGEVREILSHVGQVSVTGEILPSKWMKLVVNTMCLGPLAMLGLTMHEANKLPGLRGVRPQGRNGGPACRPAPGLRHPADLRSYGGRYPGDQSTPGNALRQARCRYRPGGAGLRPPGPPEGPLQRGRPDQRTGRGGKRGERRGCPRQCGGHRDHRQDPRRRTETGPGQSSTRIGDDGGPTRLTAGTVVLMVGLPRAICT